MYHILPTDHSSVAAKINNIFYRLIELLPPTLEESLYFNKSNITNLKDIFW